MNNKSEFKKSISTSFLENRHDDGFTQLLCLQHYEVSSLLNKHNWLKDFKIASFFWSDFCLKQHEHIFGSESCETIINWYLIDLQFLNDELNILLTTKYPNKFIKGIKRNRSFLDEPFLNRLITYPWDSKYTADILAWKEFNNAFATYQYNINSSWSSIESLTSEVILSGIIQWVDHRFYSDNSEINHDQLRRVYNYAVTYLFSKKEIEQSLSEEQFDKVFFTTIHSSKLKEVSSFLCAINHWIEFETTILTSYCFDDNFRATIKDHSLHFDFISEEVHEKWQKDSERYQVNAKRYLVDALKMYEYQGEIGELHVPKGRTKIDENINHGLYLKCLQSFLFLSDLQVNNLLFKGRAVHFSKFLASLMSFSVNRQWRYNEKMNEFFNLDYDWNQSLLKTMQAAQQDGVSNNPVPYIYESIESIISLYEDALKELNTNEIQDLINHFSYTIKSGSEINSFQIGYSVIETPFIRMGQYLLTPTSLFASNDWFYSIAQRILHIYSNSNHVKERNVTATEMEHELAEKFKKQNWEVKVISSQEASKIDGDIDLFINDGNTQLLIQLKRTLFKLTLADDYKDSLETDLKAAGQLNEAVRTLESKPLPDMHILEHHKKWIVTTSFEGVLSRIDECVKVNYFDLIWALTNRPFKSLDECVNYILSDKPFTECRHFLEITF